MRMCQFLGESCYVNVHTGNSSYTDPSALTVDDAGGSHGNAVCSITLTNPVNYYNDRLLSIGSVTSEDDHDDNDNDEGIVVIISLFYTYISV